MAAASTRVRLNTTVTGVLSGAVVVFDTVEADPLSMYNTGTGAFTIPTAGVYEVNATICAGAFSAYPINYGTGVYLNGAPAESSSTRDVKSSGFFESESVSRKLALAANDVITIPFFASDGSPPTKTGTVFGAATTISRNTWASVKRIE